MAATSHVVVVGHGMVGHRFVEALRSRDAEGRWRITVLAEERDAAYDRVGLTGYTEHWDRARLALPGNDYAGDPSVELRLDTRVVDIDRDARTVVTADGSRIGYDALVLATGSSAFVPPVPGRDLPCCHVYRTLDDLDAIHADAQRTLAAGHTDAGVVIGGGLLGLEAANALLATDSHPGRSSWPRAPSRGSRRTRPATVSALLAPNTKPSLPLQRSTCPGIAARGPGSRASAAPLSA